MPADGDGVEEVAGLGGLGPQVVERHRWAKARRGHQTPVRDDLPDGPRPRRHGVRLAVRLGRHALVEPTNALVRMVHREADVEEHLLQGVVLAGGQLDLLAELALGVRPPVDAHVVRLPLHPYLLEVDSALRVLDIDRLLGRVGGGPHGASVGGVGADGRAVP